MIPQSSVQVPQSSVQVPQSSVQIALIGQLIVDFSYFKSEQKKYSPQRRRGAKILPIIENYSLFKTRNICPV
jgi:hypothetical protein